jgi:hypothetical protein
LGAAQNNSQHEDLYPETLKIPQRRRVERYQAGLRLRARRLPSVTDLKVLEGVFLGFKFCLSVWFLNPKIKLGVDWRTRRRRIQGKREAETADSANKDLG